MNKPFEMARIPRLLFGPGRLRKVPRIATAIGQRLLVLTSTSASDRWPGFDPFVTELKTSTNALHLRELVGEPSPEVVDQIVEDLHLENVELVIAVGGGSIVDAGKAIAAMLPQDGSVVRFLEGVGTGEAHDGRSLPFIAVPTTAGTGSEATNNAVLSRVGYRGFKKSLRHEAFIPYLAVLDAELMTSCPAPITAACGMDALTQLIEAYVSSKANPTTDLLAEDGLSRIKESFTPACGEGAGDVAIRGSMAYAAFLSGVCLTNVGLGIVHGLASPLGGLFPAPHGVICGTLLAAVTRTNIKRLLEHYGADHPGIRKYAALGRLFANREEANPKVACGLLCERLDSWTDELALPKLATFGVSEKDIPAIVKVAGQKNNPIELSAQDLATILKERL